MWMGVAHRPDGRNSLAILATRMGGNRQRRTAAPEVTGSSPAGRKDDAGPSGPALAFLLTGEKPLEFRTTKGRNSPAAPQGGPGYESCRAYSKDRGHE